MKKEQRKMAMSRYEYHQALQNYVTELDLIWKRGEQFARAYHQTGLSADKDSLETLDRRRRRIYHEMQETINIMIERGI